MKNNGILYLLISYVIWGFTPLLLKLVSIGFPAGYLVATRYLLGSAVLLIMIFVLGMAGRLRDISRRQWGQLVVLGLIGSGVTDLLWIASIRSIGAVLASFLVRLEVPLGVLMASLYLRERITRLLIVAASLSLMGLAFIAFPSADFHSSSSQHLFVGVSAAVAVALLWAFAGVYAKRLLSASMPPLLMTWVRLTVGGLFGLAAAWATVGEPVNAYLRLGPADWLMLVLMGVFSSAVALYLYYLGLELVKASVSSLLLALSLFISTSGGVFLGERLTMLQWLGVASIVASLVITMYVGSERPAFVPTASIKVK